MSNIAGVLMHRMKEARQRLVHVVEECDAIHRRVEAVRTANGLYTDMQSTDPCTCDGCKIRPMVERTMQELRFE